jgi:hypothetical protein
MPKAGTSYLEHEAPRSRAPLARLKKLTIGLYPVANTYVQVSSLLYATDELSG